MSETYDSNAVMHEKKRMVWGTAVADIATGLSQLYDASYQNGFSALDELKPEKESLADAFFVLNGWIKHEDDANKIESLGNALKYLMRYCLQAKEVGYDTDIDTYKDLAVQVLEAYKENLEAIDGGDIEEFRQAVDAADSDMTAILKAYDLLVDSAVTKLTGNEGFSLAEFDLANDMEIFRDVPRAYLGI